MYSSGSDFFFSLNQVSCANFLREAGDWRIDLGLQPTPPSPAISQTCAWVSCLAQMRIPQTPPLRDPERTEKPGMVTLRPCEWHLFGGVLVI